MAGATVDVVGARLVEETVDVGAAVWLVDPLLEHPARTTPAATKLSNIFMVRTVRSRGFADRPRKVYARQTRPRR